MSTELQMSNLGEVLRDRVRTAIVSAIPDDQIDTLIKAEFENYFKEPTRKQVGSGYHAKTEEGPTRFELAVRAEIDEQLKPIMKQAVSEVLEGITSEWNDNGHQEVRGGLVNELAQQMAPMAIQAFIQQIAGSTVLALQQQNYQG
jgi:hypothetical protein